MEKEKSCKYIGVLAGSPVALCMAYAQGKQADGRIWAHYPICSDENCPIIHPVLRENCPIFQPDDTKNEKEDV